MIRVCLVDDQTLVRQGIRERLAAYGGQVDISTRPGEGFLLDIRLPLDEGRHTTLNLAGEVA